MNVDWKQLASMCVVFTTVVGVVLWIGNGIYFPDKAGGNNTHNIEKLEIRVDSVEVETESDIQDVRIRMNRAWDSVNEMRTSLSDVKSDQRLIKKDVENILAILRGRRDGPSYRSLREE